MGLLGDRFVVCLHDVTPASAPRVARILATLDPRVRSRVSFAAVPSWHGRDPFSAPLDEALRAPAEVLLHGFSHRRARGAGIVSLATGGSDELSGLSRGRAVELLRAGRAILERAFQREVLGLVPPAWQAGALGPGDLAAVGLRYLVGHFAAKAPPVGAVALDTWSWDLGRIASLGWAGEALAWCLDRVAPRRLPVVAIHPRDLDRGYLPRVCAVVDELLRRGRQPTTFRELLLGGDDARAA